MLMRLPRPHSREWSPQRPSPLHSFTPFHSLRSFRSAASFLPISLLASLAPFAQLLSALSAPSLSSLLSLRYSRYSRSASPRCSLHFVPLRSAFASRAQARFPFHFPPIVNLLSSVFLLSAVCCLPSAASDVSDVSYVFASSMLMRFRFTGFVMICEDAFDDFLCGMLCCGALLRARIASRSQCFMQCGLRVVKIFFRCLAFLRLTKARSL